MALMLLSVRERTSEIGLRVAVGATPRDIVVQFLMESTILALGGWTIGVALGGLGALGVKLTLGWQVALPGDGARVVARHGRHHRARLRRCAGAPRIARATDSSPGGGMTGDVACADHRRRRAAQRLADGVPRQVRLLGPGGDAAERGLRTLKSDPPDLVILDVMLPEMDGLAVCRKIRESSKVPVIMLTARGEVSDRIVGLELGADDYLPKPFEPRELVARMQAVLRRKTDGEPDIVRAGQVEVNWTTRVVRLRGKEIPLTTAEFELLGFLVRNQGKCCRASGSSRGRMTSTGRRSIDQSTY
jgi:CheY-like chemotaxis protein